MKVAIIPLIALLAVISRGRCTENIGKDGFNYYKDYLRGRSDEVPEGGPVADRMYYYRTPLQLYPGLLPALLDQEYRKRTGNAFKNHMLNKEMWDDGTAPPPKRSSKAALSLMMGGKHEPYDTFEIVPDDEAVNRSSG